MHNRQAGVQPGKPKTDANEGEPKASTVAFEGLALNKRYRVVRNL